MDAVFNTLLNFRDTTIAIFSPYYGWIEFLSVVISGLMIWGILHFMKKADFFNMKIEQYMDIFHVGDLPKHRSLRRWEFIKQNLKKGDEKSLKSAIASADRLLDELLKISGYPGKNMNERLEQVGPAQLSNINDVWSAHKISERIAEEKDFNLNEQEAEMLINIYKKSFQEFELID